VNQSNFSNYAATADAEGKFVIENITPGTYILSADRTGYLQQYYGARSTTAGATQIKLDAGQAMKDLVFKLTPQAIIYGRIVDSDGDPLPYVSLQAWRWAFVDGKKQITATETNGNQFSQADGTFIVGNLRAGLYYLSAESNDSAWDDRTVPPANAKPQESSLRTYFPDAITVESASPIDVAAGAEVRGIEIHVRRGRAFSIRGRIEAAAGPIPSNGNLMLISKGPNGNFGMAWFDKSKTFQFKNVLPGSYVIQAQNAAVETRDPTGEFTKYTNVVGRVEVTVEDRDVVNVVLALHPGAEIRGVFRMEGVDPAKIFGDNDPPNIRMRSTDVGDGFGQEVKNDGSFRVEGLSPTLYRVELDGLRENMYVKAINFAGRDVNGKDLDLTSGASGEMEIVLSPNGAEVTGAVRDADGKPVPGAVVQICDSQTAKTVNADQNGQFDFKGLAPGDYKAYAWEDRGEGVITDPDFRKAFESKSVKLSEKSRENIDPLLITKDAMEVQAAKIR
jgi:protocatechuate 3,4-dioxygenase beta subunit